MHPGEQEKVVLHVDGDAFFAACELTRNPGLRGKPVVTGYERGIVTAATYEAKKLGIRRAMPIFRVKKEFPQVTILSGDYALYGMYAKRLYAIVRRYAARVEEYGIDECFGDLTGQDAVLGMSYEEIAARIHADLDRELAISFSLGVAPTKALAKLGSKFRKPHGLTFIRASESESYLRSTPIKDVWGIGRAFAEQLPVHGIHTAYDLTQMDPAWLENKFAKPLVELCAELRGESLWGVHHGPSEAPHSVQRTRTFTPPSIDRAFLWSHLSGNVEEACAAARQEGVIPTRASFFIKSQEFRYAGSEVRFLHPSDSPSDILAAIRPGFLKAFRHGTRYRATGVTLFSFRREEDIQLDVWGTREEKRKVSSVFRAIDGLAEKYGASVVSLASSMKAEQVAGKRDTPHEAAYRDRFRLTGTGEKHLSFPVLGEVD